MLNEFYFSFYLSKSYIGRGKKVKIVPLDLSLLTPLALAHWVMLDGSRGTSKGLYLCTDSFTRDDVKRLSQYLINKYDIKCSIHKAEKKLSNLYSSAIFREIYYFTPSFRRLWHISWEYC
jgi:LAGLIDADG DNA endonuclease family protein